MLLSAPFWRVVSCLFGSALLLASSAGAATWPGAAPCNGTLQQCIDGVAAGSIVELANSVADETVVIEKSLTLRAAAGKIGVIGGGASTRSIVVSDYNPGGGALVVTIQGLVLDNALVEVGLYADSGHQITVRNCSIRNEALSNNTRGIDFSATVPATLVASYNEIESNGNGVALYTNLVSGTVSATFLGNQITAFLPALSGNGIELDLRGSGTVDASLYSNLIYGVAGCNCGGASGIQVSFSDTPTSSIAITNNTLDDLQANSDGIVVGAPVTGASVAVDVFNNIVTRATQSPVVFPTSHVGVLVTSGYNDFFDNAGSAYYGGYPPGGGMLAVDPQFTSAALANYHLKDTSPLIDAGASQPPGGLPATDADHKPRKLYSAPDLGAFEVPEPDASAAAFAAGLVLAIGARRR